LPVYRTAAETKKPGKAGHHSRYKGDLRRNHKIARRSAAGAFVGDQFEGQLLAILKALQSGLFDCRNVNKHILAAIIGLNESEAFLSVEPLYRTCCHVTYPRVCVRIESPGKNAEIPRMAAQTPRHETHAQGAHSRRTGDYASAMYQLRHYAAISAN
jgi:hypothetical protein